MKRALSILFISLVVLVSVIGNVQAMTEQTIGYCANMCMVGPSCYGYPNHVCYCPNLEITDCWNYCQTWCE
jgi:hypothetical protein